MALTNKEMMFEFEYEEKIRKKSKKKLFFNSSKSIKINISDKFYLKHSLKSSDKLPELNNEIILFDQDYNYNELLKFYQNTFNFDENSNDNILKSYKLYLNIIDNTKTNKEKLWAFTTGLVFFGYKYTFLYQLYKFILPGQSGHNYAINTFTYLSNFFKEINTLPISLKIIDDNKNELLEFINKNIINNELKINNTNILMITNNNFLTPDVNRLIDILNRYFIHLSKEFDIINIGIYIPNKEINLNYIESKKSIEETYQSINNLIYTINSYRIDDKINNFEIKYQNKILNKSKYSYSNDKNELYSHKKIKKINFITNYGYFFTIDNNKFLKYIDTKLIIGGNLIFFINMNIPVKSKIIYLLTQRFKKVIITKATLDDQFNWVFIGKGYNGLASMKIIQTLKINNFINIVSNSLNNKYEIFLNNVYNVIPNLNNNSFIKEIDKKYIEIYKWCLDNKIKTLPIYEDVKPQLIDIKKLVNYFFPYKKDIDRSKIQVFNISLYSVTFPKEADEISSTIKHFFSSFMKYKLNDINNLTITDGTANVGGNTLSFSYNFNNVNAIELDSMTFNALKNNCIKVYKRKNIKLYQGSCLDIIPNLKQDIIFIDPPWNGMFYKSFDKLHLKLGDINIIDIIKKWYNKDYAKLFAIKCPSNQDFEPFILEYTNIFIQKLKNWNVIYIYKS